MKKYILDLARLIVALAIAGYAMSVLFWPAIMVDENSRLPWWAWFYYLPLLMLIPGLPRLNKWLHN